MDVREHQANTVSPQDAPFPASVSIIFQHKTCSYYLHIPFHFTNFATDLSTTLITTAMRHTATAQRILLIFTCLFLFAGTILSPVSARTLSVTDSLLRVLDREIAQSDQYIAKRVEHINTLKVRYADAPSADLAFAIAELYAPYQCDSAMRYYTLAEVISPVPVPDHIKTGLEYCRQRMYGGESIYTLNYRGIIPPPENTHEYAFYAYELSEKARANRQNDLRKEWLIRSALADVRCGITDNASSWMLAEMIYDDGNGDLDRAYRYVQYSMENAAIFNGRLRFMQINKVSKIIGQAHEQQQQQAAQRLHISMGLILLVLVCTIILAIIVIRQNRRLHSLNKRMYHINNTLHESNNIKERYISLYLEAYADNLRRMSKMAPKVSGQTPTQFLEAEMPAFYQQFDTSFLSIYPDFVEEFNALLQPEERIVPGKDGALNTELRIFALIRLGINSSTRIATLLCYSANTIYNYRARIKNHAIGDRDGFEECVKRIGTFTE